MANSFDNLYEQLKLLCSRFGLENSRVSDSYGNEKTLQAMWFEHLLPNKLKTIDGENISIEQTGYWNHGVGPDFVRAKIRWDHGTYSQGDVELHIHAKDWFKHSHHQDMAYSGVILNVSLYGAEPILHVSNGAIKSVELINQIDKKTLDVFNLGLLSKSTRNLPTARAGLCSMSFSGLTPEHVHKVLRDAGLFRLYQKALFLRNQRNNDGDRQTLWENLSGSLGFGENKIPFKVLARVVPYSLIEHCSPQERDALLFGASGFLPRHEISSFENEQRAYFKALWNFWWNHPLSSEIEDNFVEGWSMANIRPSNHPHRRIGALSSISSVIKTCLKYLESKNISGCLKLLQECSHTRFDYYYTINSHKKNKKTKLIGINRARQILWNCFIPWILSNNPDWKPDWGKFPSEPENLRIRRAIQRLFPGKSYKELKFDGLSLQGMIHVLEFFCSESPSDCSNCALPGLLTSD